MEAERPKKKLKAVRSKHSPFDYELINLRLERRWEGLESIQKSKAKLCDSGKYLELAYIEKVLDGVFSISGPGVPFVIPDSVAVDLEGALDTLKRLSDANGEEIVDWIVLEASLLLGKILFTLNRRDEALSHLRRFGMQDIFPEVGWPIHATRLIAECCALRGCELQQLMEEKGNGTENSSVILRNQRQAMDIVLLYLQELSALTNPAMSGSKLLIASNISVSVWLEAAVYQTPLLYLLFGDTAGAVQVLRSILRAKENRYSKTLRLSANRQLALLLLRAPHDYIPPSVTDTAIASMYSLNPVNTRPDFMLPEHRTEEVVLVLTIAERLVRQEALQSRFPDDRAAYDRWHQQVTAVYDLAALVLATFAKARLADTLEESMRFSFDDDHVWMQFGLALISAGKYERALVVLKQCLQQYPDNVCAALMVCKLCINHLPDANEAIRFASRLVEKHPEMTTARLSLGLGHALMARKCLTDASRQKALQVSVDVLKEAHELDPLSPECAVYYALQLAMQHRIQEAMVPILVVLDKNPVHHHALWLLVLLQSALKNYREAMVVCDQALHEYPNDLAFALLKIEIEAALSGVASALVTARSVLPRDSDLKEVCEASHVHMWLCFTNLFLRNDQYSDAAGSFKKISDGYSLNPQVIYFRGQLLAREKKMEQARESYLGALASDPNHVACLLALSALHLELDNPSMAEQYISQALAVDPSSFCAWRQLGSVLQQQGEHERAAECFVNALQIESLSPISPFSDIPLSL